MTQPLYPIILDKALDAGLNRARAFCTSKQLRKGMRRQVLISNAVQAQGVLNVPHYWAIYKHDGRGTVTTNGATFLVWFPNPKDDPRLKNGQSPIHRADIKKLSDVISRERFLELKKSGKMIISKVSGPTDRGKANPFFSNKPGGGMAGFQDDFVRIARRETFDHMERFLRESGLKKKKIVVNL